jgi:hypothetical protein
MVFKVIITHPSEEGDEHTYYGMVFLNPGKVQTERLKYSKSDDKLTATFAFDGSPIKPGKKFLAILVPVDESEITNSTTPEFKIHENSPDPVPEVVNF